MERSLLIVGAGAYSYVVYEIAVETGLFKKIDFADDSKSVAPNGERVVARMSEINAVSDRYTDFIVAIGNADVRLDLTERVSRETALNVATIVSPRAYVSPSAVISAGAVIEPMSVVQAEARIGRGTLVSSGAIVKHNAVVEDFCYIDCNFVVYPSEVIHTKTKKTLA